MIIKEIVSNTDLDNGTPKLNKASASRSEKLSAANALPNKFTNVIPI